MHDAIIIGGGIVGTAVGYHLAREGMDPLLIDRHDEGAATDAGAGIIAPATSSRTTSNTWFRLAVDAFDYYPTLTENLADEQAGAVGYSQSGLLAVAGADERITFETALARIGDRQTVLGHPEPDSIEEIAPNQAQELFPPLKRPERAFYYSNAARVDGRTFTNALRRAGEQHGLTTEDATVESIRIESGEVSGVVADGSERDAPIVVIAGGAWSTGFGETLGVEIPVEPHRGQILHLDTHEDTSDWPTVIIYGGEYLVPWPGGEVAAGATREEDSGFDPRVTAGGVYQILDETFMAAPGLADAEFTQAKVGLRPASADGLPILGEVSGINGAYLATGHGATGLQLGPYSGKLIAQRILDREPDTDISHLGVDRFAN